MSGILRLESLTKGNTLKQGDKTPLKYRLFDADGEKLNIAGKSAVARLMYPDFLRAGYESETLTVSPDNTVTFSIDKVIKPLLYYVEITVDDKYIFPSRVDESKINIDKSSKGSDVAIIEIIGKDILIRDVREQVETEIKPVVDDMIIANQKVLENEKIVQDVNSLAQQLENRQNQVEQFNNQVITEMTDKDVISAPEVILARDGEPTLQKRLDRDKTTTDALIRQKANQYEIDVTQEPYNVTPMNATAGINQAIEDAYNAGGGTVRIPYSFAPYMIDPLISIKLMDDINLKIDNGVTFKAKAVAQSSYRVFELVNTNRTNVYGRFKILGERNEHTGTGGEWGMGVEMRGASNAYFEYIEANDCWGDGVYIGSSPEQNYCENITIGELYADNNRRQGISVVSVKGLKIGYGLLTNTNGTAPEAGIDLEPNNGTEFLQGVDLTLETSGNAQHGVFFFFGNYIGSANYVDVSIKLLHSHKDYYGISFSGGGNISGKIDIEKCFIEKSGHYGINQRNWSSTNPDITIHKPTILNPLELQSTTSDLYASAIIINRMAGDSDANFEGSHIGNIKLIEPEVIETRSEPKVVTPIYLNNNLNSGMVEKIEIVDPTRLDGLSRKILNLSRDIKISDKHEVLKVDMDQSVVSAGANNYATKYTTKGVEFDVTVNLANSLPIGVEQEFVVDSDYNLTVHTTNRIYPIEPSFGKNISASGKGCRIKIKKVSSNQWEVLSMVGAWTANDV